MGRAIKALADQVHRQGHTATETVQVPGAEPRSTQHHNASLPRQQHVPIPPRSQCKPEKHAFPVPKVCRITVFKDLPLNGKILAHNYTVFSLPKHIREL